MCCFSNVLSTTSAGKIKRDAKGWTPIGFLQEADSTYVQVNTAFAKYAFLARAMLERGVVCAFVAGVW